MSSKAYRTYSESLRDHFKVFYANWPPGELLRLGDTGTLDGKIFIRDGNVQSDLGLQVDSRTDQTGDHYSFKSEDSVSIGFTAKGQTTAQPGLAARAAIEIGFSSKDSVFFNAAGVRHHSLENPALLGRLILELHKQGKWSPRRFVVTRLVESDNCTTIISGSSRSSIRLEAQSDVPRIDLADASLKLDVATENSIAFEIVSASGHYPLLGLSGIKPARWYVPGDRPEWSSNAKRIYMNMDLALEAVRSGEGKHEEAFLFGDI